MFLLLPSIPIVRLIAKGRGVVACLAALTQGFVVTGSAGNARGIDPGDPGVPAYGRKIYHLRAFGRNATPVSTIPAGEAAAVERKSGVTISCLIAQDRLDEWRTAFNDILVEAG